MRHTQKALQTDTAVLLEKLLHMFASFGRSALLKPRRERLQTDWPQVGIPLTKNGTLFTKFVLHAGEQRIRHILIHQNIVYIASPFTSAPAQMLFPLLLCTPRAYTGTSGCRRRRGTSRKAQTDNSVGTACRPPSRPHNRYRRRHSYILPCTPTDSPSPPSAYRTVYPAGTACA